MPIDMSVCLSYYDASSKGDDKTVELLNKMIVWIAKTHEWILSLNDFGGYNLSDKELHFLVIGVLGILMIFVVFPFFKWLARRNLTLVIAWIYVFTLLIVISFAIEIGQRLLGTGTMEMADIYYGLAGFLTMFLIFVVIRGICILIVRIVRKHIIKN